MGHKSKYEGERIEDRIYGKKGN